MQQKTSKKYINFIKDNRAQIKWKWFTGRSRVFVSRLSLLYCLHVPYSLVVTGQVRVDLSALLWVLFPCVFWHFPIWCHSWEVILNCIDSWSLLSAVQTLIISMYKKLLLILHVITKEIEYNIYHFHIYVVVKKLCLWKSHNLDKRTLDTYMRMPVNKDIDKCTFTLSQAMNFDW